MNTTTEFLQEINSLLSQQIETLETRIDELESRIEIDKITIKTQEKTIKLYIDNLNSKSNE